jgi:hypothetical protein
VPLGLLLLQQPQAQRLTVRGGEQPLLPETLASLSLPHPQFGNTPLLLQQLLQCVTPQREALTFGGEVLIALLLPRRLQRLLRLETLPLLLPSVVTLQGQRGTLHQRALCGNLEQGFAPLHPAAHRQQQPLQQARRRSHHLDHAAHWHQCPRDGDPARIAVRQQEGGGDEHQQREQARDQARRQRLGHQHPAPQTLGLPLDDRATKQWRLHADSLSCLAP